MKNKKKKPTNKDFVAVIGGLLKDMEQCHKLLQAHAFLLNQYVEFKGDGEEWKKYLNNKKEEYERDRLNQASDKTDNNKGSEGK